MWEKDDSVVNSSAVTDKGNIEGLRTYDRHCVGYETRDITREIHSSGLSDKTLSEALLNDTHGFDSYKGGDTSTVDLVRDDDGTMEDLSTSYTGTFKLADGSDQDIKGFRYTRAVGGAGLQLEVTIMCNIDHVVSEHQWHTILKGIRIDGLDAGTFEHDDS